jgi:dihydrofolate reductase
VAELLYAATMSLDGFIAGPDGDMSWLTPFIGPDAEAEALVDEIGALLVGRRTFGGDDPHAGVEGREGEPFGGGWSGLQVVLTRTPPATAPADVAFASDVREAVALATAAADARGRRWVNVLGAETARSCLDAGLLDEVLVFVAPVLLGDGTRLFSRPGGQPGGVRLERVAVSAAAPLATMLRYRIGR